MEHKDFQEEHRRQLSEVKNEKMNKALAFSAIQEQERKQKILQKLEFKESALKMKLLKRKDEIEVYSAEKKVKNFEKQDQIKQIEK